MMENFILWKASIEEKEGKSIKMSTSSEEDDSS
jgi:hypothetical protein